MTDDASAAAGGGFAIDANGNPIATPVASGSTVDANAGPMDMTQDYQTAPGYDAGGFHVDANGVPIDPGTGLATFLDENGNPIDFVPMPQTTLSTEHQLVIRLPEDVAEKMHAALDQKQGDDGTPQEPLITFTVNNKDPRFLDVYMFNDQFHGMLADLPSIVEVQKTFDKNTYYKSGDISQIIRVFPSTWDGNDRDLSFVRDTSDCYKHLSGLTPQTQGMRDRFVEKGHVCECEQEVEADKMASTCPTCGAFPKKHVEWATSEIQRFAEGQIIDQEFFEEEYDEVVEVTDDEQDDEDEDDEMGASDTPRPGETPAGRTPGGRTPGGSRPPSRTPDSSVSGRTLDRTEMLMSTSSRSRGLTPGGPGGRKKTPRRSPTGQIRTGALSATSTGGTVTDASTGRRSQTPIRRPTPSPQPSASSSSSALRKKSSLPSGGGRSGRTPGSTTSRTGPRQPAQGGRGRTPGRTPGPSTTSSATGRGRGASSSRTHRGRGGRTPGSAGSRSSQGAGGTATKRRPGVPGGSAASRAKSQAASSSTTTYSGDASKALTRTLDQEESQWQQQLVIARPRKAELEAALKELGSDKADEKAAMEAELEQVNKQIRFAEMMIAD